MDEFQEEIKSMLLKHRENFKSAEIQPCGGCPFVFSGAQCWGCAELFPGWAQNWLGSDGFVVICNRSAMRVSQCPCHTLGVDFVTWRINLFLKDAGGV